MAQGDVVGGVRTVGAVLRGAGVAQADLVLIHWTKRGLDAAEHSGLGRPSG